MDEKNVNKFGQLYMREWYLEKRRTNPEYFERRNQIRREERRRKRISDPKWIARQVEKLINECDQITKRYQREQKQEQKKVLRQEPLYKKRVLLRKLHCSMQNTKELTDGYVKKKLWRMLHVDRRKIPQELIEVKRAQLKLIREIRKAM